MISYNDENNVYCYDIKDDIKHVSEVESGRKGYFCLGCKRELQAVISKKVNRVSYFRHDPKAVKAGEKCTYRDETHRHKLAKDILQRLKRIKVPALYKYPPRGEDGHAILLEQTRFIEAHTVENELTFYEDLNGDVHNGRNPEVDERFLLVRPDVAFFDLKGKPILLIEIIATHKIDFEKLVKLKRLGIDTVQVRIPKDSPQSIEDSFKTTEYIKWVYNNVEESTEYIPTPNSSTAGVLSTDELQRKLFEESLRCREAQIRNFIRSIERCLESKPYRDIEGELRSELSRVEKNTERNRERLEQLQEELRALVYREFEGEFTTLRTKLRRIKEERRELEDKRSNLEERYTSKKEELGTTGSLLELRIREEVEGLGRDGKSFGERKADIEREEEGVLKDIDSVGRRIERIISDRGGLPERFENLKKSVREGFEFAEGRERAEINRVEEEERGLPLLFGAKAEELEREFIKLRERAVETVQGKDCRGGSELSRRIIDILEAGRSLNNFEKEIYDLQRIRAALECFRSGAFKDW